MAREREAQARRERQAAEQRERDEQAAREAAEEERDELQEQITQIDARFALDGFRPALRRTDVSPALARIGRDHDADAASVMVTPRHGMTALIAPTPSWGFSTAQRSSSSGWTVTTHTNSGHVYDDELVVYDNRQGIQSIRLVQEFDDNNDGNVGRFEDPDTTVDGSDIMGLITSTDGALIRSSAFPSADGTDRTFAFNHDSMPDTDRSGNLPTDGDDILNNDLDTYRVNGTFMGASGRFECTAAPCEMGRRGDRYVVTGTWRFVARDTTAIARIEDRSYAYFGWWRRAQRENDTYSYLPFAAIAGNATTGGNQTLTYTATVGGGTAFDALTGSATYRGPAIGQYAIYQPLNGQSGAGEFTAQAELTANFNNNMVSGTVTDFSNDPDWSLTLNLASMEGGDVDSTHTEATGGKVDWTIAGTGTSDVQGNWDAEFYSESNYVGQVPDGVVGTFTAAFDADINNVEDFDDIVASLIGAFGAEK